MYLIFARIFNLEDGRISGDTRALAGKIAGMIGMISNCLLAVGKLIVGLMCGAVSIIADGMNNLSDTASSIVTMIGFHLSQQPADADHPYGHGRFEYLSGLSVAVLILLLGGELVKASVEKILNPVTPEASLAAVLVLLLSAVVKYWMFLFYKKLGNRIESSVLLAASADSRNDVISVLAVLAGYGANYFFRWNIDGYVGLGVACFILISGFGIARDTVSPLLGNGVDKHTEQRIADLILSREKVLGFHDLLVHDYGPGQCYASVHVEMDAREDPLVCHEWIDALEEDAWKELNMHLVIHHDPVVVNDEERNEILQWIISVVQQIDPGLSIHDFRLRRSDGKKQLVFDLSVPYALMKHRRKIKARIEETVKEKSPDYAVQIHIDGGM